MPGRMLGDLHRLSPSGFVKMLWVKVKYSFCFCFSGQLEFFEAKELSLNHIVNGC